MDVTQGEIILLAMYLQSSVLWPQKTFAVLGMCTCSIFRARGSASVLQNLSRISVRQNVFRY